MEVLLRVDPLFPGAATSRGTDGSIRILQGGNVKHEIKIDLGDSISIIVNNTRICVALDFDLDDGSATITANDSRGVYVDAVADGAAAIFPELFDECEKKVKYNVWCKTNEEYPTCARLVEHIQAMGVTVTSSVSEPDAEGDILICVTLAESEEEA